MEDYEIIELVKDAKGVKSDYAVAKILGMSRSNLSNIKNKKGRISCKTLLKIGRILDKNPNDLLDLGQKELNL